jgi:peptide/nickel transport system permease protein
MLLPLYTDILLWFLVIVVTAIIYFSRKQPQFIAVFQVIKTRKMGISTLVILLFYMGVGLLDSIHYRSVLYVTDNGTSVYGSEVRSVLDDVLAPRDQQSEKTYSAPFAQKLFNKETASDVNGNQIRVYPLLKHTQPFPLKEVSMRMNITLILILAVMKAMIIFIGILMLWSFYYAWRFQVSIIAHIGHFIQGNHETCWRTFWFVAFMILLLCMLSMSLLEYVHVFGTDKVGDDIFYSAIKSIRTAVVIGTVTTLVLLPFAIAFGILAGFYGGWLDDLIQYIYTTLSSIPGILLIAAFALMLNLFMAQHPEWFNTMLERADARLLGLCVILGITSWTGLCRLLRAETMKVRELDYVMAARSMGVSQFKIMLRHILPSVMYLIVISIAIDFSGLVLAESILSYVGVGVDPTMHSWGNMINSARLELGRDPVVWWPLMAAFSLMFILVIAANLFADVVRDALDPRLRR